MSDVRQTLQWLLELQELDKDLFQVRDELKRLPAERHRRQASIEVHRTKLAEIDKKLFDTRLRIKEIEDMTSGQRQRLRKLENEAAATTDTALLVAFQHEIRTLRRDIGEADEEGIALVMEAERFTKERSELQAAIAAEQKIFEEYSANIAAEIHRAESRCEGLSQERRKRMKGALAPDVLTHYEKLLEAREGLAMALLDGLVCQGCYVSVPNNVYVRLARASEIVHCPSCGRILYLPRAG